MNKRRGRIVALEKRTVHSCVITQGITKKDQRVYDNDPRFSGRNGTYIHDHQSETSYKMKVVVYEDGKNPQRTVTTDVTDLIKDENPTWKHVSSKRLGLLQDKIVGKKIDLYEFPETMEMGFDSTILQIKSEKTEKNSDNTDKEENK